jgi:excinuclease UvrABC nuclease subunit
MTEMTKKLRQTIKNLPTAPGVYFFKDKNEQIIYIGKAINIKKRVQSHFSSQARKDRGWKNTIIDYSKIKDIDFIPTKTEKDALILESQLVKKHQPYYNLALKDDKNFLYIGFTNERYPKVFTTRQPKKIRAEYLGPFIAGHETKEFLTILRKFFPYRTCNNPPEKPCLYYHLGQCAAHKEKVVYYKYIVEGLKTFIKIYDGKGAHIECYDISNTSGSLSVGSMITFINNRPNKSLYRKFRIKTVSGSNDPESLREVLARRLNHPEWKLPGLVIVDGGRPQLSKIKGLPIPIIGIAKRASAKRTRISGTLYSPYSYGILKISQLPEIVSDTILRARDEAHRFAIKYHRARRIKQIK